MSVLVTAKSDPGLAVPPSPMELTVDGMTCQGCVRSVTRVLNAIPGVEAVAVSLERGEAQVQYDPSRTGALAFRETLRGHGQFTLVILRGLPLGSADFFRDVLLARGHVLNL